MKIIWWFNNKFLSLSNNNGKAMNQEIKPAYVTREQAKRLKEKEFDLPTYAYYSGLNFYTGEYKNHSQTTIGDTPMHKMLIGYTSAPEQWQVVEWAFQKYQYSIEVEMNIPESGEYDGCYVFNGVIKGSEDYKLKVIYKSEEYPTREKALSDAISHFLTII